MIMTLFGTDTVDQQIITTDKAATLVSNDCGDVQFDC